MRRTIFFIICLFFSSASYAATGDIDLKISKSVVRLGDTIELKVVEKGSSDCGNVSVNIDLNTLLNQKPENSSSGSDTKIQGLDAFDVVGTSESTRCQSINGKSISETEKSYFLSPKKEGSFTIGPVVKNGKSQGGSIQIKVERSSAWVPHVSSPDVPVDPISKRLDLDDSKLLMQLPGPLTDPVVLSGLALMILIVLVAWQMGRLDKKEQEQEIEQIDREGVPEFHSIEEAEEYVRRYYAEKTGEKTESRTYAELLELESDVGKKVVLRELFSLLEQMRFARSEIDLEAVNCKVKNIID